MCIYVYKYTHAYEVYWLISWNALLEEYAVGTEILQLHKSTI